MTTPVAFDSATPRFGLPLLFVAQAQKEAHVNEAHVIADAMMHCAIAGQSSTPPAAVSDGECWLVSGSAGGAWAGQSGKIACHHAGTWLFVAPPEGMRVFDRSIGQDIRYDGAWHSPQAPASPAGGTVVDVEARTAIETLIAQLRQAGVFPS